MGVVQGLFTLPQGETKAGEKVYGVQVAITLPGIIHEGLRSKEKHWLAEIIVRLWAVQHSNIQRIPVS